MMFFADDKDICVDDFVKLSTASIVFAVAAYCGSGNNGCVSVRKEHMLRAQLIAAKMRLSREKEGKGFGKILFESAIGNSVRRVIQILNSNLNWVFGTL